MLKGDRAFTIRKITGLNRGAVALLAALAWMGAGGCDVVSIFGASEATYEVATGKTDQAVKPFTELRHNDCADADKGFTDVIVGDPKDPRAYVGRAEARLCLGKYDEAIADYTTAIQMDPKWFDYFGRAMAYRADRAARCCCVRLRSGDRAQRKGTGAVRVSGCCPQIDGQIRRRRGRSHEGNRPR